MLTLGVSRRHARALAAGLPRRDHLWITTEKLVRFHNNNSMKCLVSWIPLNLHVRFNQTQGRKLVATQTTAPD